MPWYGWCVLALILAEGASSIAESIWGKRWHRKGEEEC